jgi:hypothetical protein
MLVQNQNKETHVRSHNPTKVGRPVSKKSIPSTKNTNSRKANRVIMTSSKNSPTVRLTYPNSQYREQYGQQACQTEYSSNNITRPNMTKRKEAQAGRQPRAGRERSRQSKRTNTTDEDFPSSAKSGQAQAPQSSRERSKSYNSSRRSSSPEVKVQKKKSNHKLRGKVKRNNRIVLTVGGFETVYPRRIDELTEENEKLKSRNRTLIAEREQFLKQNRMLSIKAERMESQLRSLLEFSPRSTSIVVPTPRSEVQKASNTESKDCRENNLELRVVANVTSPKPALIEPTLPVVITEEKKDEEDDESSGDLMTRLKREVATLKKEKLDGQICQIHERLDLEKEHQRSTIVLNKAIANLNEYVENLKLEISKLKSHKGLNTEAPVFQFNPSLLKNLPIQSTIFQHTPQQATLALHHNQNSFLTAPSQQFPLQAQQSIYRPHQAAALMQEHSSISPRVTSIKDIYADSYDSKLNIASQVVRPAEDSSTQPHPVYNSSLPAKDTLPPQRLSEHSADAGDWSNDASGWMFEVEEEEEEIVRVQVQPNHNRNVKAKQHKSRGGGSGSARNSGRKQRGKNVSDDKNKYLNMESNVNHSSKKSQSKRRQKSRNQEQQNSRKSSSKSSQRPPSLNYRISKSKKGSSTKQATMKGLILGPHDPRLTVRLEPPSHLSKKKSKRNYYRKNKGR